MASLTRLRTHIGLWAAVAVLTAAAVLVAAGSGAVTTRIEDGAVRQVVAAAGSLDRDIVMTRSDAAAVRGTITAESMEGYALSLLPPVLSDALQDSWGFQHTGVSTFEGIGASLTGAGLRTEPHGYASVVSFHHQPGLVDEVTLVDGRPPATQPGGEVLEVMVADRVAERLGMVVGGEYQVHPGQVVSLPDAGPGPGSVPVRLTGVFTPHDQAAPAWQHAPLLLDATVTRIPVDDPPLSTLEAVLVTDAGGFRLLTDRGAILRLDPSFSGRVRFDPDRLDTAWAPAAVAAVAQIRASPVLGATTVETRLPALLDEFLRQAASARAVTAVVAAGILAALVGLLVLVAGVAFDRRRDELRLLRARGGSLPAVFGRLAAEGLWLVLPAAIGGWVLCRLLLPGPLLAVPPAGEVLAVVLTACLGALVVPAAGALAARRAGSAGLPASSAVRRPSAIRTAPIRLTAELSVGMLAGLGVVLLYRRGLALEGVDPYLSAVPVLVALSAGLLTVRLYRWPLRAVAAAARRRRGVVGFVALAGARRPATAGTLGLLVLVLAAATGGFAGGVHSGVAQARDAGAVRLAGAHVRLAGEGLSPAAAAQVAEVPGVTAVAVAGSTGVVRDSGQDSTLGSRVVVMDIVAYQRVLDELGVGAGLPPEVLAATPGRGPVPVLAHPGLAGRADLTVRIGEREHPVTVVGDTSALPGAHRGESWMLVPRQALADPGPVDELLVAAPSADPDEVHEAARQVAGGGLEVSSVAGYRAALEASGFNAGLTLVFVGGSAAAAAAAGLAVVLMLILRAAPRGRELSVLRTVGMSHRQARGLLLVESLPPVLVAVAAGCLAGAAIPSLLGPALALETFTGGVAVAFTVDPTTGGLLAGLVLVLATTGVVAEAAVNRRLQLGRVLRIG
jgi:putative ABC transport system permease protein